MSTDRDAERIVRSWLREDRHEDADRVLNTVLADLDTTPQRRSAWSAWRTPIMNTYLKVGLVAAAVVLAVVVGLQFIGPTQVVGPGPTEEPSPTATPAITPEPTPAAFPTTGLLTAGRHSMTREGVSFSIDVGSGWTSNGEFLIGKGVAAGEFIFWSDTPDGVYADPCGHEQGPVIGPSAAELAAAVAAVPGTELVSGPTEVTVGGRPAQYVVIRVPEDVGCNAGEGGFQLWYDEAIGGRWPTRLGDTIRTWIVEADAGLVWIDCETVSSVGAQTEQEIQDIVDSIVFE